MAGVQAVFGSVPLKTATGLVSNCNLTFLPPTGPPGFPTLVDQFVFHVVGQHYVTSDGTVDITLDVANAALPRCTLISIFKADLAALASLVPAGQTPVNGYAVVWQTGQDPEPDALTPLVLTVTNAPVVVGNPVYKFDKVSGAPVQDGVVAEAGTWTVSFVEDPGFVVTQAAAAQAVTTDPSFTG